MTRGTLLHVIFAGLVTGALGAAALLWGVEPNTEFFLVMGAVVGILSFIVIDLEPASGNETNEAPYPTAV